jgi:LSD1 subclass zinc finger protein
MPRPLRICGVFRNVPQFIVIQLPPGAEKFRCRSCGWINVFELVPGTGPRPVVDLLNIVS